MGGEVFKKCSGCNELKPLSDFSFRNKLKGTRQGKCKECVSNFYINWYKENGRHRKQNYCDVVFIWNGEHPKEIKVYYEVTKALKEGIIVKPLVCSICGRTSRLHAHHNDYDKPLVVTWVCSSCHKKIHLGLMPT